MLGNQLFPLVKDHGTIERELEEKIKNDKKDRGHQHLSKMQVPKVINNAIVGSNTLAKSSQTSINTANIKGIPTTPWL